MKPVVPDSLSRRAFVRQTAALAATAMAGTWDGHGEEVSPSSQHPFFTPGKDFADVSRGDPKPHKLSPADMASAGLTADTWRLEITADPLVEEPFIKLPATLQHSRTIADGTAIDLPTLMELGRKHEAHFVKAMQCLNIPTPLGQGLWTGVPLREVLRSCGKINNVRRIYFWGYHNHDPKQVFKSSVSYGEAMETPPDDLPVFLAYRLNGEPLSPERGGPVRMVVPWAHGFKSIKWLQHIFLTNDYRINDTYATQNNDPESSLKTAAYLDKGPEKLKASDPIIVSGRAVVGRSGLKRVEYWLRSVDDHSTVLADDDAEVLRAPWKPCELEKQPDWNAVLPKSVKASDVLGFHKETGKPLAWPLRYGMISFKATVKNLKPGKYEIRARSVDLNDDAQPEPRPAQKNGKNAISVRKIEIVS